MPWVRSRYVWQRERPEPHLDPSLMAGKGDGPRPFAVTLDTYARNWDATFRRSAEALTSDVDAEDADEAGEGTEGPDAPQGGQPSTAGEAASEVQRFHAQ